VADKAKGPRFRASALTAHRLRRPEGTLAGGEAGPDRTGSFTRQTVGVIPHAGGHCISQIVVRLRAGLGPSATGARTRIPPEQAGRRCTRCCARRLEGPHGATRATVKTILTRGSVKPNKLLRLFAAARHRTGGLIQPGAS